MIFLILQERKVKFEGLSPAPVCHAVGMWHKQTWNRVCLIRAHTVITAFCPQNLANGLVTQGFHHQLSGAFPLSTDHV